VGHKLYSARQLLWQTGEAASNSEAGGDPREPYLKCYVATPRPGTQSKLAHCHITHISHDTEFVIVRQTYQTHPPWPSHLVRFTGCAQESRNDVPAMIGIPEAITKGYLEVAPVAAVENEISLIYIVGKTLRGVSSDDVGKLKAKLIAKGNKSQTARQRRN
jgi:hypothetical protein